MLRFLTAGESHGKALVGILEGLPSGLPLSESDLQADMARRKLGFGRGNRQKIEPDKIEILSGVRHGKTLGSPLGLLLPNLDFKNWEKIMATAPVEGPVERRVDVPRPGHADFVGGRKYAFSDMRNVLERASARETAMRVAIAGAARKLLSECGISIASRVVSIGPVVSTAALPCPVAKLNAVADASPARVTDAALEPKIIEAIAEAAKAGDTLGGVFEVIADGLPTGLGSYVQWDRRLEAPIAEAFMSLNAIKGVEIGLGFEGARKPGSEVHDPFTLSGGKVGYAGNRSGGIDGGMTTGQPVVVRAAMKPLATLMKPIDSVDLKNKRPAKAHIERSDVCAVPSAAVIGESLLALVLADAILAKFGGDSMTELLPRVEAWRKGA
jgi:chorismate synthase